MRKGIFLCCLLFGICAGYLSARNGDLGLQIVMIAVGALFGGALGGGLSPVGKRQSTRRQLLAEDEIEPIPGSGMTGRDIAINYQRDRGLPPHSHRIDAETDKHMFDPDKIV